jgi:ABC-type multidrug transport system fused ATPase/permease subunit
MELKAPIKTLKEPPIIPPGHKKIIESLENLFIKNKNVKLGIFSNIINKTIKIYINTNYKFFNFFIKLMKQIFFYHLQNLVKTGFYFSFPILLLNYLSLKFKINRSVEEDHQMISQIIKIMVISIIFTMFIIIKPIDFILYKSYTRKVIFKILSRHNNYKMHFFSFLELKKIQESIDNIIDKCNKLVSKFFFHMDGIFYGLLYILVWPKSVSLIFLLSNCLIIFLMFCIYIKKTVKNFYFIKNFQKFSDKSLKNEMELFDNFFLFKNNNTNKINEKIIHGEIFKKIQNYQAYKKSFTSSYLKESFLLTWIFMFFFIHGCFYIHSKKQLLENAKNDFKFDTYLQEDNNKIYELFIILWKKLFENLRNWKIYNLKSNQTMDTLWTLHCSIVIFFFKLREIYGMMVSIASFNKTFSLIIDDLSNIIIAIDMFNIFPLYKKIKIPYKGLKFTGNIIINNLSIKKLNIFKKPINAQIKPHTIVGIIGTSGSGKSSFLKVFPLIYNPTKGSVFLEAYDKNYSLKMFDIKKISSKDLNNFVIYINQSPNIFKNTIKKNVSLSYPYSDDLIIDSLIKVELKDMLIEKAQDQLKKQPNFSMEEFQKHLLNPSKEREILKQGLHSFIDEKNISGGQQQRINIARALCKIESLPQDQNILICLDEFTANLDPETSKVIEKLLFDNIKSRNSTIIYITHNKTQFKQYAQYVMVFKDGVLVEQGFYNELKENSKSLMNFIMGDIKKPEY